ncbi:MAG: imidazolonepropionase [Acidobacteria bacterium]|nr:MAG: imidazolonepropionase [Acidobacteriota bacterium]
MDLLVSPCSQLLTLLGSPGPRRGSSQGELSIIPNGAVLIQDETIKAIGPANELESDLAGRQLNRISAEGCVVMTGIVDSHSHPIFARPRHHEYELIIRGTSYQEIAQRGGGILSSVRAVRETSKPQLLELARIRIARFLEHGTTTLEAKSGYGLDCENEIKLLEVIHELPKATPLDLVPTFLGAHEIPEEYKARKRQYLELVTEQMIPLIASRHLAEFCDCFVEPHIFSLAEAEQICMAAQRQGLKVKLHADQLNRSGATQLGVRLKAVSVDHLEQVLPEDIQVLSRSATVATLLPGSVFHLGLNHYAPARALIDAGVPVALATDFNPGSSPTLNMQMILSIACTQMRMTPAEAIVAATINGAHALCCADRSGSLESGKQADLCIMDVEDYRQIPYFFGMNHCKTTLKKGRIVYQRA